MNHPKAKEVTASTKKILIFEYPKILSVSRSLLFLNLIINIMLEIKIINGKSLIIIEGIKIIVKKRGR